MEKKIKDFIDRYQLQNENAVVVGVSGGPDSVVLLHLLTRYLPKEKIIVAHANHGLRLESRADERFVKNLAEWYEVKYVPKRLKLTNTSEESARTARYDFLEKLGRESGATYIILGHHLNDQAETVLFNLIRGVGPIKMWGMNEQEGQTLRPLLDTPKKEIIEYARRRLIKYRIDRSNFDIRYSRNRLRKKVLPQLEKLNPNFLNALSRNSSLGTEMGAAMDSILAEKTKRISKDNYLDLKKLNRETEFIKKEIIRRKLQEITKRSDISYVNVKKVLDLLSLPGSKSTEFGKLRVIKNNDRLLFGAKPEKIAKSVPLAIGQEAVFGVFNITAKLKSGQPAKNNILLDPETRYNLVIRPWREGDRIKTKSGTKKIQDVFTDAKIDRSERRNWPVVVSKREVLWIPLVTASEKALGASRRKVLILEVKNEGKN